MIRTLLSATYFVAFALCATSVFAAELRYDYQGVFVAEGTNQLGLDGRAFHVSAVVDLDAMPISTSQNANVRTGIHRALSFSAQIAGLSSQPTVAFDGIQIQDVIVPGAEAIFFLNSYQFDLPSGNSFRASFPGVLLSHDVFDATLKPRLIQQSDVVGSGTINMSIPSIGVLNDAYHAANIVFTSTVVPEPATLWLAVLGGGFLAHRSRRRNA